MRLRMRTAATVLLLAAPCPAARLGSPAQQAFGNYAAAVEKRLAQQHATPDHPAIRTIYVKAEGAETLAAAKARNLLVSCKCYTITALEDQADAILSISSEKQGASSIFTHIPFTGQKIYTSATLFDRKTGEVLWTTDWSDIWFGSPAKAGERIVQRLKKYRQCK